MGYGIEATPAIGGADRTTGAERIVSEDNSFGKVMANLTKKSPKASLFGNGFANSHESCAFTMTSQKTDF